MLVFELSHAEFSRTASSRKSPCEGQGQDVICENQRGVLLTVGCLLRDLT